MKQLWIVSATREGQVAFWRHTRLGLSLKRLSFDSRITVAVAYANTESLPAVYNRAIEQAAGADALLFVHDDVYLDDFHLHYRLAEGLGQFDVIGLAGNTAPDERHVGWSFWRDGSSGAIRWYENRLLSGAVAHFLPTGEAVSFYGLAPRECLLLDGCFLGVNAPAVRERRLRFDERFAFHFYDLDFCQSCRAAGLRLGTWPIAVTHASGGKYGTPEWEAALQTYRMKWLAPAGTGERGA